jgi:hypothetical protein
MARNDDQSLAAMQQRMLDPLTEAAGTLKKKITPGGVIKLGINCSPLDVGIFSSN